MGCAVAVVSLCLDVCEEVPLLLALNVQSSSYHSKSEMVKSKR